MFGALHFGDGRADAALVELIALRIHQSPRIDLLVNNAGIGISGAAEFAREEDIDRQIQVNLSGALETDARMRPW